MPDDTTPHGGEALHPPPDRATIPGSRPDAVLAPLPPDSNRPPLPTGAQAHAADIEDEEADPVVDTGPGIDADVDDGKTSVTQQPA